MKGIFDALGRRLQVGQVIAYNMSTAYAALGLYEVVSVDNDKLSCKNLKIPASSRVSHLGRPSRAVVLANHTPESVRSYFE